MMVRRQGRTMLRVLKLDTLVYGAVAALIAGGCALPRGGLGAGRRDGYRHPHGRIRHVFCLYDQRPWLNVDAAGDRDPEGIRFRVFLMPDEGKGVLCDGTFHVDMYQIDRKSPKQTERTLVSDWHYPTTAFQPVKANVLGMGYHLRLRWGKKSIPGHEIEVVTRFEAPDGNVVRSGTKRFRVPTYTSKRSPDAG